MGKFETIISAAQKALSDNTEWKERYREYAKNINGNIASIKNKKEYFNQWAPLYLYMSIGQSKGAASTFNLRYLGQIVANLKITTENKVILQDAPFRENNKRDFACQIHIDDEGVEWKEGAAVLFRRHFSHQPLRARASDNKSNEEHRLESMLLTEFSRRSAKDKIRSFHNIQPIKIAKIARFQMPTPFRASRGDATYATFGKGGGIDILARVGKGKGTRLCVIEVKDEYSEKEPPTAAITQGLIYATFIRELLRSKSGNDWWNIFGFRGRVPKKLLIYVACSMPFSENIKKTNKGFGGVRLCIDSDIFELHYIYFKEKNKVTYAETSLGNKAVYGSSPEGTHLIMKHVPF